MVNLTLTHIQIKCRRFHSNLVSVPGIGVSKVAKTVIRRTLGSMRKEGCLPCLFGDSSRVEPNAIR